jgi:hypothetical protein
MLSSKFSGSVWWNIYIIYTHSSLQTSVHNLCLKIPIASVISIKIHISGTIGFNIHKLKGSFLLSICPLVYLSIWVNYNFISHKNVMQWCKQTNLENVTVVMVPWYTKLHSRGGKPFLPVPSRAPVGSSYFKFTLHVCLVLLDNLVVHKQLFFTTYIIAVTSYFLSKH